MSKLLSENAANWQMYWSIRLQPWRREPEISYERRKYLSHLREVPQNIAWRLLPFVGIVLTRADIEWLLSTLENDNFSGPVDWRDISQRTRSGLNLCGAILNGVDLSDLPLARLRGGLTEAEARRFLYMRERALGHGEYKPTDKDIAQYQSEVAIHLEGANLANVSLDGACLTYGHLEGANLAGAYLQSADLQHAFLAGAILNNAIFDSFTDLTDISINDKKKGAIIIADLRWGNAALNKVNWNQLSRLGDEKDPLAAARAYRQLSLALRQQSIDQNATYYAHRSYICLRRSLRVQKKWGLYLGSWLIELCTGWGYRLSNAIITYLSIILLFALGVFFLGNHTTIEQSIITSFASFHGQGLTPLISGNSFMPLTLIESVIGSLYFILVIIMFTRRMLER
jgi:uncharacterized protein YjbI with pentapeptide repeats